MQHAQNDFDSLVVYGNLAEHGDLLDSNCSIQQIHMQEKIDFCTDTGIGNTAKGTQDVPDLHNHQHTFFMISYEPIRRTATPAPPKRFFRTFWRSVARRLMERESTRLSKEVNITAV